jgi:hypothetical protein
MKAIQLWLLLFSTIICFKIDAHFLGHCSGLYHTVKEGILN